MLHFLPAPIKALCTILLYFFNTVFWFIPLVIAAIFKFSIPLSISKKQMDKIINAVAFIWIDFNEVIRKSFNNIQWHIEGMEDFNPKDWYLILSNHRSWVDILVLLKVFRSSLPFPKFFLKSQLIWVPFLGIAWWAMDMPFMKRYSKEYLAKHPEKKGKDLETTQKACRKFRFLPISIINFPEGTRFTWRKHQTQKSPFQNMLKPKAGGINFVLNSMEGKIKNIIDVSIRYDNDSNFWEFAGGKTQHIYVRIKRIIVDENLYGNYETDEEYRKFFQNWLNDIWQDKDQWFTKWDEKLAPIAQA